MNTMNTEERKTFISGVEALRAKYKKMLADCMKEREEKNSLHGSVYDIHTTNAIHHIETLSRLNDRLQDYMENLFRTEDEYEIIMIRREKHPDSVEHDDVFYDANDHIVQDDDYKYGYMIACQLTMRDI